MLFLFFAKKEIQGCFAAKPKTEFLYTINYCLKMPAFFQAGFLILKGEKIMGNYFEKLKKVVLSASEVEVRPSDAEKDGFSLVLYKNRSADKNILDRIVGPENWQKGHNGNPRSCFIEIWDPEKNMWIHKDNFGESADSNAKGAATDAMKRAGEDWGIGREIYTCPKIFINAPTVEVSYGTGYEIPEEIKAKYAKDKVIVKELLTENINGAKTMKRIVLAFANGSVFFEWDKDNGVVPAIKEAPQASACNAPESEPEKPAKKVPNESGNAPEANALNLQSSTPVETVPQPAPEMQESTAPIQVSEPAPEVPPASETAPSPAPCPASPLDVKLILLDGFDTECQGLRQYQGLTMRELLEKYPNVINIIASPTFKWDAKMEEHIWEAAKEAIQLSRNNMI